jgi:hypothetical protein
VDASGGEAHYTDTWQIQRREGKHLVWTGVINTTTTHGQGTPTLAYTPPAVGTSKFRCIVKDASGQTVISDTFSRTVKPLAVKINDGETNRIEIRAYSDEKVKLNANVTGGVGPYTYTWYNGVWGKVDGQWGYQWSAVPNTTSSYEATSIAIQNGQAYYARDNYQIKVEVKDATGTVVESDMVTVRITGIVN